jgi:hypothetical protein
MSRYIYMSEEYYGSEGVAYICRYILMIDTSIFVKSNMGQGKYSVYDCTATHMREMINGRMYTPIDIVLAKLLEKNKHHACDMFLLPHVPRSSFPAVICLHTYTAPSTSQGPCARCANQHLDMLPACCVRTYERARTRRHIDHA